MPIGEGRSFAGPPQPQERGQIQQRPGIGRDPFDPGGGQAPFNPFGNGVDEATILRSGGGGREGAVTRRLNTGQVMQMGGEALDQWVLSLLGTENPQFKEIAKMMATKGYKSTVKKSPNGKQRVYFVKKAETTRM